MSHPAENNSLDIPFFNESVAAGFPSPAVGELNGTLDLNEYCIRHPSATYFIRARGESMIGVGIGDGDILIVDRSLTARNGDIIIAAVSGEFTVKRLEKLPNSPVRLIPENPDFSPITITPELNAEFFGVVTHCLKKMR
ncbi:MAG: translesion error-prone DNA polymerase V autoproteolytic subunit [Akkermansia sp.]|nr:translesion error-prone DNA polymerase V autoproteolytic subunit [Akkermansia sp.]